MTTRPLARLWKNWLEPIVFAVAFTTFGASAVRVDGASMMPSLRHGERIVVPKYETWLHRLGVGQFSRGDILIFKPPAGAVTKNFYGLWNYRPYLVKRLIGLPGDRVRIAGGDVYVNGAKLDQTFVTNYWKAQGCWDTTSELANRAQSNLGGMVATTREVTVPDGHYFVMGDNRTASGSEDSRMFGAVPLGNVAGRAVFSAWPLTRKADATYPCSYEGARPQDFVKFGGPSVLNSRVLGRPAAFSRLK
ncbi:signal peptidase I [Deinococcus yavapaiensis]|uniref:Signal peptidase I n=1 Tax=Deinococcus yavapaiensis KR-236 TaxID=694435 RepID=A0A318SDX7_9DEIO|nr:signal peptidase I [Deinococcus yavapaiensis]PYE55261.1 signal peptidase I [Deinococcus yavapaiensis KR-236]